MNRGPDRGWLLCGRIRGTSNRKWRLFACACCRRVWDRTAKRWRAVVEEMEEFSDGLVTKAHAQTVIAAAGHVEHNLRTAASCAGETLHFLRMETLELVARCAANAVEYEAPPRHHVRRPKGKQARRAEEAAQDGLLRDVFGPFPVESPHWRWTPVPLDPTWRTPTAINLARAAYERRNLPSGELDQARLGVLADALEEAGCTDRPALEHLRGSGPHVRGCWVLDLVLGKG